MSDLATAKCEPCAGGSNPLDEAKATALLAKLNDGWALDKKNREIFKDFKFKGFYRTMSFVNAVAWIANQEGHHPDMEVGWGHCLIRFTTHDIGGLSENDFICAAKIDALKP